VTLAAGEVMLWRMSHPRHPRTQAQIPPQPQPQPAAAGQPATLSVGARRS